MSSLVKRQLNKTRLELAQQQRIADLQRLRHLRTDLQAAKGTRREKLRAVTQQCGMVRRSISARAKVAREALNQAVKLEREQARGSCSASRADVRSAQDELVGRARRMLEGERAEQRQLAAWTRPSAPTRTVREKRQESDDEVRANIDDPALWPVWEAVKHKIKARGRTTRSEVFAEWVHNHSAEVYEFQHADLERQIDALEREEKQVMRRLKKAGATKRELLEAVPF